MVLLYIIIICVLEPEVRRSLVVSVFLNAFLVAGSNICVCVLFLTFFCTLMKAKWLKYPHLLPQFCRSETLSSAFILFFTIFGCLNSISQYLYLTITDLQPNLWFKTYKFKKPIFKRFGTRRHADEPIHVYSLRKRSTWTRFRTWIKTEVQ